MTIYERKAHEIIKESIKSAIFIDEKAWMPYEKKSVKQIVEENLSKELFTSFKKNNISLAVHKFKKGDEKKMEEYFFNGRNLVLLDWKLDGNHGEEYALKLLSEVVNKPHIHFCAIYTSDSNFDLIINNIISYFSGKTEEYYSALKEQLEDIYEEISKIMPNISIDNKNNNGVLVKGIHAHIGTIKSGTGISDIKEALIHVRIANESWKKSENSLPRPEIIDRSNHTIVIKNTVITILNKTVAKPKHLLSKLSTQIAASKNSFTQLLGIDMQNTFSKRGAFIDSNLLNVSRESLLYHYKNLNKNDIPFDFFFRDILLEQAKLNLRDEKLSFLDSSFLDKMSSKISTIDENDKALINTFYNGSILPDDRLLNFGDIFFDGQSTYYLCITALCDCILHEEAGLKNSNVKFKYFFVKGRKIPLKEGFSKEDGGFISYIDNSTCISWSDGEYIKPWQIHVPKPSIISKMITALDYHDGCPISINLEYKFTLKQNYAQRIANHTFAHPVRVGVDFVKK